MSLPQEITREEAVSANEKSQIYEGIERIEGNGTVYFNEENMQILTDMLGYKCRELRVEDSYAWAMELKHRYLDFQLNTSQKDEY